MSFASFGDFVAMGHHGLYVWSAYGICLAVLALNVAAPILARKRYLQPVSYTHLTLPTIYSV